jgi:two-component system LytT family sensor kinase
LLGNEECPHFPFTTWGNRDRRSTYNLRMPAAPNPPGNPRALYALWTLFWLLMIAVAVEDHISDTDIQWWEPFVWECSSAIVATAWLVLQQRRSRGLDQYISQPLKWFGLQMAWLPVLAITFIVSVYAIRHGIYALAHDTYEHPSWAFIFMYETIKLALFMALWLAIIFGFKSFTLWKQERERLLQIQKHLAESQLAQLKAQLQPHFLFNALNTISSLMQTDVERADRLLTRLADLLRASLAVGTRQATSLRDEWQLLELYASIMQERFAGRVTIRWSATEAALDASIPAMLLQPLLENAYKHGVERSTERVSIRVEASREADELRIVIHNTGSMRNTESSGIGLRNCRERLALVYGDRARLTVAALDDGVAASITMPYEPFRA